MGAGGADPLRLGRRRRALRGAAQEPDPRSPPLRLVRAHVRVVRAHVRHRPAHGRRQDDRLPHERRLAARARADRGGRGGQADGLPGRAEGPLRRAPQHRVVARARVGRRPRRLRLPGHEDPRQGHADRAARGRRRPAPVRAHRHRQLQRGHGAALRGLQPLHRRRGGHGRPGRPVQLPDRLRAAARLPQAAGGAVHDAERPGRAHPRLRGCRRGRQAGADPDQGQPPRRRGDRARALRGRGRGRRRRDLRAHDLHALAAAPRRQGGHQGAHAARPLLRAQPLLHLRGRRREHVPHGQRRPDAAQPRPPDRDPSSRSRTPAASAS